MQNRAEFIAVNTCTVKMSLKHTYSLLPYLVKVSNIKKIQRQRISWPAEQLSVSQEVLELNREETTRNNYQESRPKP